MTLNLLEGLVKTSQPSSSMTVVANVDDTLARKELKRAGNGGKEGRPADKKRSVGMVSHSPDVTLQNFCPRPEVEVIPVVRTGLAT